MPVRHYINTVKEGSLSTPGVGTGNTTFNLDGAGLVNIPPTPFVIRIDADTASEELCLVTAGSPTALTVTRGFDGTSAFSHAAGAKIRHVASAEFFEKADAHVETGVNVHGLSGGAAVVGTTTTQTLTNKTVQASIVDVNHSTSPASAFAVRVNADNTSSRDGFVWNKTALATGKSFRVISSAVDRFTVDADGKMVLNGTAAADKVLAVQESGTERVSILADGATVLGLQTVGKTTARLRLDTREATQNAIEVYNSSGVLQLSINGSGQLSKADTTGALTVALTSTLTGDVTLPLPAAGTTTRLTVRARTGGKYLEGFDQAGVSKLMVDSAGTMSLGDRALLFGGTSPAAAAVPTLATPATPQVGQIVMNSASDAALAWYRWSGAAWNLLDPAVHIYQVSGATHAISGLTPVTMTGEHYDPSGFHSTSVNTSRITPTIAGRYCFIGHLAVDNTLATDTAFFAQIRKNGAVSLEGPYTANFSVNNGFAANTVDCSATLNMNGSTDYAELVGNSSVATTTFANGTDQGSYLICFRIGPT